MIKYNIKYTKSFKKQLKRVIKQGKDIDKMLDVVEQLSEGKDLDQTTPNMIQRINGIFERNPLISKGI